MFMLNVALAINPKHYNNNYNAEISLKVTTNTNAFAKHGPDSSFETNSTCYTNEQTFYEPPKAFPP